MCPPPSACIVPDMSEQGIRDRIRERMEGLGLSMREVSLAAGLSDSYVRDYLAGRATLMKAENLLKLAPVLQTTPEWLLSGVGEPGGADPETAEIISLLPRLSERARASVRELARELAGKRKVGDEEK
jgi:transcriptional regulator with XRE-family HTH domain